MNAYRLAGGVIRIPKRAEGPDGLIGDGWVNITQEHEDYADWDREAIPVPKAMLEKADEPSNETESRKDAR